MMEGRPIVGMELCAILTNNGLRPIVDRLIELRVNGGRLLGMADARELDAIVGALLAFNAEIQQRAKAEYARNEAATSTGVA